jgi:UDP-N-acetylglucosamine 2-epimerase (non-hydrolysing)
MKVLSVVGTRPNFVKMAPVVKKILGGGIQHVLVHTGQHYDREMNQIFLNELELPKPDYFLNVGSGSHGYQIGNMLPNIEEVIVKERPDFVMVPGDTNTSLAGALASVKIRGVETCHVEAGLRSFDRTMPEEINRILIDHCSDALFCPTTTAVNNLKDEGISEDKIHHFGDTMVEACFDQLSLVKSKYSEECQLEEEYYLVTVHRAENTDNRGKLENIINALLTLDKTLLFSIHPRTKKMLMEFGLWDDLENSNNVRVMKPIGYLEFLFLLSNAKIMITDSGGVQKEAFLLGVPCVTLRDNTEWTETVDLNANILVGAEQKTIVDGVRRMHNAEIDKKINPYGDGKASERIVDFLVEKRG